MPAGAGPAGAPPDGGLPGLDALGDGLVAAPPAATPAPTELVVAWAGGAPAAPPPAGGLPPAVSLAGAAAAGTDAVLAAGDGGEGLGLGEAGGAAAGATGAAAGAAAAGPGAAAGALTTGGRAGSARTGALAGATAGSGAGRTGAGVLGAGVLGAGGAGFAAGAFGAAAPALGATGAGEAPGTAGLLGIPGAVPLGGVALAPASCAGGGGAAVDSDAPFAPDFGAPCADTCAGSGRFGSCTASVRRAAALAGASELVARVFTRMVPPSTTAATASQRRPRGRVGALGIAPGGTETELGFCAGVSSLLGARRSPPAGVGTRASRGRPAGATLGRPPSASDSWAGDAAPSTLRAVTAAGDSKPICVVVRVGCSGTGEAPGRDGVLPRGRRECGRGAELGLGRVEMPPGVVSTLAAGSGGGVLARAAVALANAADVAAGGSDPVRASTA